MILDFFTACLMKGARGDDELCTTFKPILFFLKFFYNTCLLKRENNDNFTSFIKDLKTTDFNYKEYV